MYIMPRQCQDDQLVKYKTYLSYHENEVPGFCKSILSWHNATYVPRYKAVYKNVHNEHQPHQAQTDVTFNTTGWFKKVHPGQANFCTKQK